MTSYQAQGDGFEVEVSYPDDGWYFDAKPVPSLLSPHQLFALSNWPIKHVPVDSEQPRPMIADLPASAMFVWGYYQLPVDPEIENAGRQAMPDYSRYALPFAYSEMEVFPSSNAREWDPAKFAWRRIGIEHSDSFITVMIWEGTRCDQRDLHAAAQILASVRID